MGEGRRKLTGTYAGVLGAVSILALMALVPIAWGAFRQMTEERPEEGGSDDAGAGGVEWEWTAQEPTLAYAQSVTTSDGVMYALSTAPGAVGVFGNPPKAIYTSTDGLEWTSVTLDEPWVNGIAARGGLLYAVGTVPGAADPSEFATQVGMSEDGGETWTYLEIQDPPEASQVGYRAYAIGASESGISVILGGEGAPIAWHSADGATFETVESGFPNGTFLDRVYTVGDELVTIVYGPRTSLWGSSGGGAWEQLDLPLSGWPVAIGTVDGTVVLVEDVQPGPVLWRAEDLHGEWSQTVVDTTLGDGFEAWMSGAAVGDGGVAIAVSAQATVAPVPGLFGNGREGPIGAGGASARVLVSRDLETWSMLDVGEFVSGDETWVEQILATENGFGVTVSSFSGFGNERVFLVGSPHST